MRKSATRFSVASLGLVTVIVALIFLEFKPRSEHERRAGAVERNAPTRRWLTINERSTRSQESGRETQAPTTGTGSAQKPAQPAQNSEINSSSEIRALTRKLLSDVTKAGSFVDFLTSRQVPADRTVLRLTGPVLYSGPEGHVIVFEEFRSSPWPSFLPFILEEFQKGSNTRACIQVLGWICDGNLSASINDPNPSDPYTLDNSRAIEVLLNHAGASPDVVIAEALCRIGGRALPKALDLLEQAPLGASERIWLLQVLSEKDAPGQLRDIAERIKTVSTGRWDAATLQYANEVVRPILSYKLEYSRMDDEEDRQAGLIDLIRKIDHKTRDGALIEFYAWALDRLHLDSVARTDTELRVLATQPACAPQMKLRAQRLLERYASKAK